MQLTMRRRRFEENRQQVSSEITNKAAGYRRKISAGDLVEFKFGNSDIYGGGVGCGGRLAGTGTCENYRYDRKILLVTRLER